MLGLKKCRRPACLKKFQGETGLNIHLGLVKKCNSWYRRMFSNCLDTGFDTCSANASESGSGIDSDYEEVPLPWTGRKLKRKRRNQLQPPDTLPPPLKPPDFNVNFLDTGQPLPWTRAKVKEGRDALRSSGVSEQVLPFTQPHCPNSSPADEATNTSTADSRPLFDNESSYTASEFGSQSNLSLDSNGFLGFENDSDVDLEENPRSASPVVETYPGAAKVYGKGIDTLQDVNNMDMYAEERKKNIFYPFKDADDFAMAAWLNESGASMSYIDEFLKLPMVSNILSLMICPKF